MLCNIREYDIYVTFLRRRGNLLLLGNSGTFPEDMENRGKSG
jgi:hypothetical protein